MIPGSCLCNAVTLSVDRKPSSLTQCNCSACRRYGTLWAYYKRRAVTIRAPRGGLREFTRPAGELRFRACATCACLVSWEAERGADARMGVNMRLFDHTKLADVKINVLDGDGNWKLLEHYKKPGIWISPTR